MIVAEQVVAALDGGVVTNAVNIPSIGGEDLEVLGPFLPLAAGLGRFALELARGEPTKDHARVLRRARRARHAAAHARRPERRLQGPGRPDGQLRERAADRGRARDRGRRAPPALPRATSRTSIAVAAGDLRVAGTTIGRDNRLWLVNVLGFEIEIELAPRMVVLRYDDVPGVIGRVGTELGAAGVNIANMAVSRNREEGKALMVLSLDTPASAEVLAAAGRGRRRCVRGRRRARMTVRI